MTVARGQTQEFSAECIDSYGLNRIIWYVDGSAVNTENCAPDTYYKSATYTTSWSSLGVRQVSVAVVGNSGTADGGWRVSVTDQTPPPTPTWYSAGTDPASESSINLSLNRVTDDLGGTVEYEFECTENPGGGSGRSWHTDWYFTDGGLQPNSRYSYRARARDSSGNQSNWSTTASIYTFAKVPSSPIVASPTETTLTVDVRPNDNPSHTLYSVFNQTTGSYVNASGTPTTGAVWRTDSQWGVLPVRNLQPQTQYRFYTTAKNGDGVLTADSPSSTGTTTSDSTPPNPNPSTWDVEPAGTGADRIRMRATEAFDSAGCEYYFSVVENGGGATDSGWVTQHEFEVTGLDPNTRYSYRVRTRDQHSNHNTGDWSSTLSAWTYCLTPASPVISGATSTSVDISLGNDGNPSPTTYAIRNSTRDKWITAAGGESGTPVWQTASQWRSTTVHGLASDTLYGFRVVAKNGLGVQTSEGPTATESTLPARTPTRIHSDVFTDLSAVAGTAVLLRAKLEKAIIGAQDLPGKTLAFEIDLGSGWQTIPDDGDNSTQFVTDVQGEAEVNCIAPGAGVYSIRVRFDGDSQYEACERTAQLSVAPLEGIQWNIKEAHFWGLAGGSITIEGDVYYWPDPMMTAAPVRGLALHAEDSLLGLSMEDVALTDANGEFSYAVNIPATAAGGLYTISFFATSGSDVRATTVTVGVLEPAGTEIPLTEEVLLGHPPNGYWDSPSGTLFRRIPGGTVLPSDPIERNGYVFREIVTEMGFAEEVLLESVTEPSGVVAIVAGVVCAAGFIPGAQAALVACPVAAGSVPGLV